MARDLPPETAQIRKQIIDGAFDGVELRRTSTVVAQIPPGTYTRSMLAFVTGLTTKELATLAQRKLLHPVGFNARGWAYYDETTIEQLKRRNRKTKQELREEVLHVLPIDESRKPYTAEEGVRVFKMIAAGKSLRDIVIETEYHAVTVKAINADYEECEGGVFIPAKMVERLNGLEGKLDGRFPLTDAHAIYDLIHRAARGLQCISCNGQRQKPASLCRPCARDGAAGFKKELAPHARIPDPRVERAKAIVQGPPGEKKTG